MGIAESRKEREHMNECGIKTRAALNVPWDPTIPADDYLSREEMKGLLDMLDEDGRSWNTIFDVIRYTYYHGYNRGRARVQQENGIGSAKVEMRKKISFPAEKGTL